MTTWDDLECELDAWAAENRAATLWWRDDDAVATTPALDQLLELSATYDIPLALAVIPEHVNEQLPSRLEHVASTSVLQHGLSHTNHAPPDQKKAELCAHRPTSYILADVERGLTLFRQHFPAARSVLVPPWNRIADDIVGELTGIGIVGLSTFGPRPEHRPAHPLIVTNTHADIINWRDDREFAGTNAVLGQIVGHLQARRSNLVDAGEATGLLSHHLVHTEECWQFLTQLFTFTAGHAAAQWLAADELFCP